MSIIGIILLILIIYKYKNRRKNTEYEEKVSRATHELAIAVGCEWDTAQRIIRILGYHTIPIDIKIMHSRIIDSGIEQLRTYYFSEHQNTGHFVLNSKYEVVEIYYNNVDLLHMNVMDKEKR